MNDRLQRMLEAHRGNPALSQEVARMLYRAYFHGSLEARLGINRALIWEKYLWVQVSGFHWQHDYVTFVFKGTRGVTYSSGHAFLQETPDWPLEELHTYLLMLRI